MSLRAEWENMNKTYFTRKKPSLRHYEGHIFVDQAGYLPLSQKKAVINIPCEKFSLTDMDGNTVYEGKTVHFGHDANSADDVYTADFSGFRNCGTYHLNIDGESSMPFTIAENAYEDVLKKTEKAFYFLRCGCALDEKFAGVYSHAKCHSEKAVLWDDHSVSLDVTGGWHDAGDYGRYVTAAACALAHLLYAFSLYPEIFGGQDLNIPESGGKLPDILAECKYELDWLMKMQREDGGAYHKATTQHHAAFIMPEDDKAQLFVLPVSSFATADLAAVCALASKVYRPFDAGYADRLFEAAERSYRWLDANPGFIFDNKEDCKTGVYGQHSDISNRFWAAAEMYNISDSSKYLDDMHDLLGNDFPLSELGYVEMGGLASLSCILNDKFPDKELKDRMISAFANEAERLKNTADSCGYSAAMTEKDYGWGSNMNLLKHGMIFLIADRIENSRRFLPYAEAQLHYLLGVNATGYSYVTGVGGFCCSYPHLRPAHADGIDECIPGMVSGGPNRYPCDEDAEILIPKGTPPMKCYADDVGCYSLNEITIYWNSPAVFLIAGITYGEDNYER